MISDINLFGVFVNVGLAAATVAALAMLPLRKLLTGIGAYRLAWHPALVDLALFVLLWAGIAWTVTALESRLVVLLG
jgi:hypothetical protein